MKLNYRAGMVWLTLAAFVLLIVTPNLPAQAGDERKGLQLLEEGEALYNKFEFKKAVKKFKKAIKLLKGKDNLIRAYLDISRIYYTMGDTANTKKILNKLLELKPQKPPDKEQFPRGFLDIYQEVSKKHEAKESLAPRQEQVKEIGVVEKPLTQKRPKKKKSPILLILGGVAVAAVVAVLVMGGKKDGNGTPTEPAEPAVSNASVHLESTPEGADVYVDGSSQGVSTPCDITVSSGNHEIRLAKAGYGEAIRSQDFTSGNSYSLNATLSPYTYEFVTKWGSEGSGDGQFKGMGQITCDWSNNVYICDGHNYRIQKFDSIGTFLMKFGGYGKKPGQFGSTSGVGVDSNGYIYVSDSENYRIHKFNSTGNFHSQWGSKGSGNDEFDQPRRVAVYGSGIIYLLDQSEGGNHRIQKFSSSGTFLTKWDIDGNSVCVDSSGNVYVTQSKYERVKKFSSSGTLLLTFGSEGSGDGQFLWPIGVAVDSYGYIFVGDFHQPRIQKFDAEGNFILKWGSKGSGNSQFNRISSTTIDSNNNVYVVDSPNYRILKFMISNNTENDGSWTSQALKKPLSIKKASYRSKRPGSRWDHDRNKKHKRDKKSYRKVK